MIYETAGYQQGPNALGSASWSELPHNRANVVVLASTGHSTGLHRESRQRRGPHPVTAAMGQLAAGIEAENRRAEAERLAANQTAETVN
jgi:hypothetical protein